MEAHSSSKNLLQAMAIIEYDHPERFASAPGKWSTMSTLTMITACVKRSVFGPERYIANVDVAFGSREPERDMDKFMRDRLQVNDFLPEVIQDGERTIKRSDVGNTTFPLNDLPALEDRYRQTWGSLIIEMLESLAPYKAHAQALKQMYDGWAAGDSFAALAKDSIFEGVGMYWTLRDSADSFKKRNEDRKLQQLPLVPKTDVVKAWDEVERKKEEFNVLRTKVYLDTKSAGALALSEECFALFNSHACQLGFVLTATTLVYRHKINLNALPAAFKALVEAANASLLTEPTGSRPYGRRTVLARSEKNPLNAIKKLDTPFATHFRYFWLELLATPEAQGHLGEHFSTELLFSLRDDARTFYFKYLESEFYKSLKILHPGMEEGKLKDKAEKAATDQMRKALDKWFGVPLADFESWKTQPKVAEEASSPQSDALDSPGDLEASESDAIEEEETVEDILKDITV
jgi:hypothetical protein